jgi:hypothetical protein
MLRVRPKRVLSQFGCAFRAVVDILDWVCLPQKTFQLYMKSGQVICKSET